MVTNSVKKAIMRFQFFASKRLGKAYKRILPNGLCDYGIYQTSKKFFGKILLRSGLINNHMALAYKEAFSNIDLSKLNLFNVPNAL